jgi:hypothetical protein
VSEASAAKMTERPVFNLLRTKPSVDGERALRRALKVLLRRFLLKCIRVEQVEQQLASPPSRIYQRTNGKAGVPAPAQKGGCLCICPSTPTDVRCARG